jgi:hypothetical protein
VLVGKKNEKKKESMGSRTFKDLLRRILNYYESFEEKLNILILDSSHDQSKPRSIGKSK